MIETAKAQLPASAEGLLDENEAIWRRNYLAYGIVFMLLAVGALMLALGLRLQTRLLSISEVTVEELSILRGISDRFDYLFDQGTMEPITVDLITKVINENNRQLDRLLALNERIRKDKQVISRYGSITNILSNESGDLLKLLREHEKHFRSYASYLKMMEFQSGKDPQRFFDTHEHFIAMKMPQLLTTQNRLTEKLQANISEQQSTLMIGFTVMVGGPSTDASLTKTFSWLLPPEEVVAGMQYRVEAFEADAATAAGEVSEPPPLCSRLPGDRGCQRTLRQGRALAEPGLSFELLEGF